MEQISGYNVLREVNRTALLNEKKKEKKLILFGPHQREDYSSRKHQSIYWESATSVIFSKKKSIYIYI